jgi:hypothetical protein
VLSATIIAGVLVTITVGMHVVGFTIILRSISPLGVATSMRSLPIALLIVRMAWFLVFVYAMEAGVWAVFYRFTHRFSDAQSAFYFSGGYLYISGLR